MRKPKKATVKKPIYAVMALKKDVDMKVADTVVTVPLTWADGMIGAMPLFGSWKAATKYAGDRYQIQVFQS